VVSKLHGWRYPLRPFLNHELEITMLTGCLRKLFIGVFLFVPGLALAALPAVQPSVRYMSLGDSLAAGYKAQPAIKGYSYQLYLDQVFGTIPDTVFDNASVPGATSSDLLHFQLPQVPRFEPNVVTISIGGNDLLALLAAPDPIAELPAVLAAFANNLGGSLVQLCGILPEGGRIFIHNLYEIPEIPLTQQAVPVFNAVLEQTVAGAAQTPFCAGRSLAVADVHGAFLGQQGLLLIERFLKKGIQTQEVHPTDKGYRVMEDAFRAVIGR
jgi:lysophospholipase L1-like esterase